MEAVLFDAEDPVKDDKAPAETTIETAKAAMGGYVGNIMNVLLQSNPYELYWYNKTKGLSYSFSTVNRGDIIICSDEGNINTPWVG